MAALGFQWLFEAAAIVAAAPVPIEFDLAKHKPDRSSACLADSPSEIVVCGRRPGGGDYPLEEMARIFEPRQLRAERDLGHGATGRAFVESATMPNGMVSNRLMVGVKLKF